MSQLVPLPSFDAIDVSERLLDIEFVWVLLAQNSISLEAWFCLSPTRRQDPIKGFNDSRSLDRKGANSIRRNLTGRAYGVGIKKLTKWRSLSKIIQVDDGLEFISQNLTCGPSATR